MNDFNPVAARRRLSSELRRLRTRAHFTQRDVADRLDMSASKVIRIENADVSITVNDLRAMLELYGASEAEVADELMSIARGLRSQRTPPYGEFRDVLSPETMKYLSYEVSCDLLHNYEVLLVSGLLQTEAYAREILRRVHGLGDELVESQLAVMRQRQLQLDEPGDGRQFQFIHDEAAIRRVVGGASVMREQLDHLREMNRRDGIDIYVVPFGDGAYPGMRGPVVLMEFGGDTDVVSLENARGETVFRDDAVVTRQYRKLFADLEDLLGHGEPLEDCLDRAIDQLAQEQGQPRPVGARSVAGRA